MDAPTIVVAPFDPAKRLTEVSVQRHQSKADVPKEKPKAASKKYYWEDFVRERGISEERIQKIGA